MRLYFFYVVSSLSFFILWSQANILISKMVYCTNLKTYIHYFKRKKYCNLQIVSFVKSNLIKLQI